MLKKFAHPVKQHNAHCFRIFPDHERAQRGDAHQKIFVKNLSFKQVPNRCENNLTAQDHITGHQNQQGCQFKIHMEQDFSGDKQQRAKSDGQDILSVGSEE